MVAYKVSTFNTAPGRVFNRLASGHVQTVYCIMGNFSAENQVWHRR